jgi:glucokinase
LRSYEFLQERFPDKVNPQIRDAFAAAGEKAPAVVAKNSEKDELCRMAMEIFTSAYGSEAGVAGLKWLPFGGLYLAGGLTPKNLHWLKRT